jgi:YidC/Oxa1 family membrane protein insertase
LAFLNLVLLRPILNILLVLTNVMFSNFGLGIIALTVLVRGLLMPLTLWQLKGGKKQSEAMAAMKPKMDQLKKKYAKNPQKQQQEIMKLYKEAGITPLGCLSSPMLLSTIIQFPIYIALYRAIIQGLAATPQDFLGLSQNLYSWAAANQGLPISESFLWLDLTAKDPYYILPLLVGATQWLSQKMMIPPTSDPQQQSSNRMMQIMMPLMMAFVTVTLPSGLGVYFLMTSIILIVVQYFIYGWKNVLAKAPVPEAPPARGEKTKGAARRAEPEPPAAGTKEEKKGWRGLLDRLKPEETDENGDKDG